MSLEFRTTITYELENVFGRKIVSLRDCIELSDEIFAKTQHRLNPNTLRRFFNLVKAEYPPSKSTLTILAKYCGFQSITDIYKVKNTEKFEAGILNPDTVLHFLVSLFNEDSIAGEEDPNYLSVTKKVIKFLNTNRFLTDRFQSMVAKTESGRFYYYEQLINIDKLNSFYGNGLRYYLLEKGTIDAEIFTSSLYIYKYWLSNENEKLIKVADSFLKLKIGKLPPLILARQLTAIIFYNHVATIDDGVILQTMRCEYNKIVADSENKRYLSHFAFIIANALLLTGQAEEALFYIEQTKSIIDINDLHYLGQDYFSSYTLLEAHIYFNNGLLKESIKLFEQVKSSEFPFLSRKFSCILYINLMQKIKPRISNKSDDQLMTIIKETGFKRLQYL